MSIRFGLGGFPDFLTPRTLAKGDIQLSRAPSLSELMALSKTDLEESINSLQFFDHVVFRLSGENPNEFVSTLRLYGLLGKFLNRPYTASFWTMDSHHLGSQEAQAAKHFDHVFVAHRGYLKLFDRYKSSYLPCSFSLTSAGDASRYLLEHNNSIQEETTGICAPFTAYPWQKRNWSYANLQRRIETLGIEKSFFGTVRGGELPNSALIKKILDYRVTLNLSLSDDLNMRNFEALALNRVLLTNKVPDHDLLQEFQDNIVFLEGGPTAIEANIIEALNRKPKDYSSAFVTRHGVEARILQIVESITGNQNVSNESGFAGQSKTFLSAQVLQCDSKAFEKRHSHGDLVAKSGWVSIGDLLRILSESRNTWSTLLRFVATWGQSFFIHVLTSTVGRSSFVRVLFRIFRRLYVRPCLASRPS